MSRNPQYGSSALTARPRGRPWMESLLAAYATFGIANDATGIGVMDQPLVVIVLLILWRFIEQAREDGITSTFWAYAKIGLVALSAVLTADDITGVGVLNNGIPLAINAFLVASPWMERVFGIFRRSPGN